MVDARAAGTLWRAVRDLPLFGRLLAIRMVSQFGDGLFQAGLAGGLLFSTERAVTPWQIAGSFAVLFLPYSLLGPFAAPCWTAGTAAGCWCARTPDAWCWSSSSRCCS